MSDVTDPSKPIKIRALIKGCPNGVHAIEITTDCLDLRVGAVQMWTVLNVEYLETPTDEEKEFFNGV